MGAIAIIFSRCRRSSNYAFFITVAFLLLITLTLIPAARSIRFPPPDLTTTASVNVMKTDSTHDPASTFDSEQEIVIAAENDLMMSAAGFDVAGSDVDRAGVNRMIMSGMESDESSSSSSSCPELYVVKEGETLHSISAKCEAPFIQLDNPHIQDTDDNISAGSVLLLSSRRQLNHHS